MANFKRPTTTKNTATQIEGDARPEVQIEAMEEIMKKDASKFVKYDQIEGITKGHNFKDVITDTRKRNALTNEIISNKDLGFDLSTLTAMSQKWTGNQLTRVIRKYLGEDINADDLISVRSSIINEVSVYEGKETLIVVTLNKVKVLSKPSAPKTLLDACKTGDQFKVSIDSIPEKLVGLMSNDNRNINQYAGNLVIVLDPIKVIEKCILVGSQLGIGLNENFVLAKYVKLTSIKFKNKAMFFGIMVSGASNLKDVTLSVYPDNFVMANMSMTSTKFLDTCKTQIFGYLPESQRPAIKMFRVGDLFTENDPDKDIKCQMLGVTENEMHMAPLIPLDPKEFKLKVNQTGNPMLDTLMKEIPVQTKIDVAKVLKKYSHILDGRVYPYDADSGLYLLVDVKKLFVAVMFSDFYNLADSSKFNYRVSVKIENGFVAANMSV